MDCKLLVGYITNEYARRSDFYDYLNMLDYPEGSILLHSPDASPAAARNRLVEAAFDIDATHLVLIDDDHKFPPNILKKLLVHDKDIVSALYIQRAWPHKPLVFDVNMSDGNSLYSYLDEAPRLREIANAGLGFCLFKMEVFKRMEKPWFRLGELDPTQWSDDTGFFRRALASGFKLYVDENCPIGHLGTMIVTPEWDAKEKKWYTLYNTDGKTEVRIPQNISIDSYEFR